MRSFTNKLGEVIVVSKEHLDTAVRIKKELQKASPSFRCNWNRLKKMMEIEGFPEAEASEAYRCLIKDYQASIGELDSKEKYVDLVSTSKLQSIREALGDMHYANHEVKLELTKLRKLKKDLTLFGVLAEQVYDALIEQLNTTIPSWSLKGRILSSGKRMILFLSDWHIGAVVVNVGGNSYNYEIAKDRVKELLVQVNDIAIKENVTDIDVVCLGDLTEHISMRKVNQAFESEFPLMVQVVKAFELIRDLLMNLTKNYNVTYTGVSGNHDRANGDKDDNIDGDSTIFLINYMVKTFAESALIPRLTYVESDSINYSARFTVNGANIKAVHGDHERGNRILASHSADDGAVYNLVAMGHIHHYNVTEVGSNQFEAYFGSLMGRNNYGKRNKYSSNASQGLVLVKDNGRLEPRYIDLQL